MLKACSPKVVFLLTEIPGKRIIFYGQLASGSSPLS